MKEIHLLAILLVAALSVRAPYVFQESVWNDETVYMWIGGKIAENPLFIFSQSVAFHSYGYLLDVSTAFLSLFVSLLQASRIATFLASIGGVLLTYFLARELTNQWGGLAAGAIVALNPLHVFYSVRSLTDVWLAATLTLFAYAATRFDGGEKSGLLLGGSVVAAMMSRVTGVLVLPLGLAFLGARIYERKKLEKGTLYGGGLIVLLVIGILAANFLFFGSPLQFGGASLKGGIFTGSRAYYIEAAGSIYSLPVFLLALPGIYFAMKNEKGRFTALSFLTYFLWFSIMTGEKVPRYILQTVPLVAVLAAVTVYEAARMVKIDERAVAAGAALALLSFSGIAPFVEAKTLSYTGFEELGEKIAALDSAYSFDVIYSQSARQIRAFSGIEYASDGGKIKSLPEDTVNLTGGRVLVQLDVWEYAAPEWAYPLSQETLNGLAAENFTVVDYVEKDVPTQDGLIKAPVGFLLAK